MTRFSAPSRPRPGGPASRRVALVVSACAALVASAGCASEDAGDAPIEPKLSVIQTEIFDVGCAASSCHSTKAHSGDLVLEAGKSHAALVGVAAFQATAKAEGKLRVVAGDPDASFLLAKCTAGLTGAYGAVMPMGDSDGLSARKLTALRAWIAAGAADD